ncbi:hypothetical protein ABPG75_004764 [Micractinium tetrahymenae]
MSAAAQLSCPTRLSGRASNSATAPGACVTARLTRRQCWSDTVRARFAVGMFERVAGAAGVSRLMQAWPCGAEAEPGSRISWSTQASLFSLADSWRLRPHLFTAARQRWEEDDIDRFELVVCLDSSITAEVLTDLSAARPAAPQSYVGRICCLTDFLMYCSDEALLRQGSGGMLDRQLRGLLRLALPSLRPSAARVAAAAAATGGSIGSGSLEGETAAAAAAVAAVPSYMLPTGIQRPALQGGGGLTASHDGEEHDEDSVGGGSGGNSGGSSGERWEQAEAWDRMALLMAVCCAGLVQHLLDCRPDDVLD